MEIIDSIIIPEILDKLIWKHNVTETEVRQVFLNKPRYRFIEKGKYKGEYLYLALGITDSGRYLAVYFIYKKNKKALIVTARDMTEKERKRYAKK
ncbi:MAG: BrnT family toxin [Nitrospirota bacterium]